MSFEPLGLGSIGRVVEEETPQLRPLDERGGVQKTAAQIAALVGAPVPPAPAKRTRVALFSRVSSIEEATPDAVVFALDEGMLQAALASKAGLILARGSFGADARVMVADDPKYAFALCGREFAPQEMKGPLRHRSASVDRNAQIGEGVVIGANAVVEADAVIGDDTVIGAGAVICQGVQIGARVVVQSGAVLGATGFGYVRHKATGEYLLFPQQGRLVIEDDVEIGANTTIDRGALAETRIGKGTKIDNLVQIGHNCIIGRNVIIASQVGISGSCVIEDGAVLAGQVGLGDHVRVGKGVILGGQGGVFPGKTVEGPGEVFAGTPAEPVKEYLKNMAKVRRLK